MKIFTNNIPNYMKLSIAKNELFSLSKICLCLALVSLTFSACSKKNSAGKAPQTSGEYYFSAKLNGTSKDFHTVKFQGGGNDNRWEHVVVGGNEAPLSSSTALSPALDFEIWRMGGNIGTGTYVTTTEPEMISRYAVQTSNGTVLYNNINARDVFTVKIDAISKDGIKGTFSGTLTNSAGVSIIITDGSFNLPYNKLVNY
jgi:hypothetical protein